MNHSTPNRRGVLLLVVLGMLAMFAMVAIAFVVLTGHERRTADAASHVDQVLDVPEKTLHQAFNVVATGSTSPQSAIKSWSLMEKIYGNDLYPPQAATGATAGAPFTGTDLTAVCGGQLLSLSVPDAVHKIGCTLTVRTGIAAGMSTKIVGIQPGGGANPTIVHILPFDGNVKPQLNDQYIINGFPYGGTGFGYNPTSGLLDDKDGGKPIALLPSNSANWNSPNPNGFPGPKGGANCDYTAADYQDPLLAFTMRSPTVPTSIIVPIPSLHRADLIAHWAKNGGLTVDLLRQISFRPIGANSGVASPDHPNFTGSNSSFKYDWDGVPASGVNASWDVDNDGDGVTDSVWVDLGFPVRFTAEGKAYKPLFAILCLDLDGRLNLNAHGSLAQTDGAYYANEALPYNGSLPGDTAQPPVPRAAGQPMQGNSYYAGPVNKWPQSAQLPRGQGRGPAEVNLLPLFSNSPGNPTSPFPSPTAGYQTALYQNILVGNAGLGNQIGRYGEGAGGNRVAGTNGTDSPLNWNNWFGYNELYWNNLASAAQRDAYGSPPDTQSLGAIGIDPAGRPLYVSMGGRTRNSPYDIDLSHNAAHATNANTPDSPYSVAELEQVLRPYDRDSSALPTRLTDLTKNGASSMLVQRRGEVTTESFSVPCGPTVVPEPNRDKQPDKRTRHPVDLAAAAMTAAGKPVDWSKIADLLPWEVQNGLKMDVNRPFGAGSTSGARSQSKIGTPVAPTTQIVEPDQPAQKDEKVQQGAQAVSFSYDASGTLASDSLQSRQLYAKHLYMLMMLSADLPGLDSRTGSRDLTARLIAQWAVNVVAYRDHNSIMIAFNYVVDPITNGWAPDGKLEHTVWGCKRPDLLISETLAFHDRRTEDLSNETVDPANVANGATATRNAAGTTTDADPHKKDPNFDQRYRQQGSLFVELLNPWTANESQSKDLLLGDTTNAANGVLLTQTTTVAGGGSPVWRLIIVDPTGANAPVGGELRDPDDPLQKPQVERAVYFVPTGSMTLPADIPATAVFAPAALPANAAHRIVTPGQYAVIGSGNLENNSRNKKQTLIGLDKTTKAINGRLNRYITLDDVADVTAANPFVLRNNSPKAPVGFVPRMPVVMAIDTPRRLSVSEPVAGYAKYEQAAKKTGPLTYNAATEQYNQTLDIPLDLTREADEPGIAKILDNDGTYVHFRIIYLQRLADPTRPYVAAVDGNVNVANPYRTIDAMPVDLTTFNGVTSTVDPKNTPIPIHFEGRQRGDTNAVSGESNLWKQEAFLKTNWNAAPGTVNNNFFANGLVSSLGYLNDPFYKPAGAASPMTAGYQGDPPAPFPWLNWAYRPFVNEFELLLVPAVSQFKLFARNDGNPRKYYAYMDEAARPLPMNPYNNDLPYPHLLNVFDSAVDAKAGQSTQVHRILGYLGVPTPYNHMTVQAPALNASLPGPHWFHPPFNNISTYREPGRINLNTISSPEVFMGLVNFHYAVNGNMQGMNELWDKFVKSRRRGLSGTEAAIDPSVPSRFMQPFRTAGGAWLSPPMADGKSSAPSREIDVTLLRSDPDTGQRPLFAVDDISMKTPPLAPGTPDKFKYAHMDYNRNPYFRYQALQKLAGSTTTHSNVFAIWITEGYFEVTKWPAGSDAGHPDGYQLGQEVGSDTGDIVRHRAFYIFDRSIPTGFIRGQDVNSEKATLLKRYIE